MPELDQHLDRTGSARVNSAGVNSAGVNSGGIDNAAFETLYSEAAAVPKMPWDLGAPQPLVVALADAGEFRGDVLDIGCGYGENSVFLASRGLAVTGLDWAAGAVQRAAARAAAAGVSATFAVADATRLDGYDGAFDTVLDSALYHCLDDTERQAYLVALSRATRPGARLHLLCFSTAMPAQSIPDRFLVSEASLRNTVGTNWTIERLAPAGYTSACTPEELAVSLRAIQGDNAGPQLSGAEFETDGEGRVLLPMWQLTAVRAG